MSRYKSARSKACDIPRWVKDLVYERDGGLCIICQHVGFPNAHYIRRSQGGLGIPENVVCLCPRCHDRFDNGQEGVLIGRAVREYLMSLYPNWDESKLYYRKWTELNA